MRSLKSLFESKNDTCECCDKKKDECECDDDCSCGCKKKKSKAANESYEFDKFMDSILISEFKKKPVGDSPNRERAKRHQERPLNRIKFGDRI